MNMPLDLSNAEKYLPISFRAHSLSTAYVLPSGGKRHTLSSPTLSVSRNRVDNTVTRRAIISKNMIKWLRLAMWKGRNLLLFSASSKRDAVPYSLSKHHSGYSGYQIRK